MRRLLAVAIAAVVFCTSVLSGAQASGDSHDPRAQALKLYQVLQKEDWKGLYYMSRFSDAIAKQLPPADLFAKQVQDGIDQSGSKATVDLVFLNMSDIEAGDPEITGNYAKVPVGSKVTLNGKVIQFRGTARMILDGPDWKWDLTGSDDAGKATQTALTELLGKPAQ